MILNYSTKITPEQTIGEIQKMLSAYNISAMMTQYDGRNVSAVLFRLSVAGKEMSFKLPCNWRAVAEIMRANSKKLKCAKHDIDDQAIRTAWRIIKDWIEAQLALVEINMVTIPQVFLPYTITGNGQTLSERIESGSLLLE